MLPQGKGHLRTFWVVGEDAQRRITRLPVPKPTPAEPHSLPVATKEEADSASFCQSCPHNVQPSYTDTYERPETSADLDSSPFRRCDSVELQEDAGIAFHVKPEVDLVGPLAESRESSMVHSELSTPEDIDCHCNDSAMDFPNNHEGSPLLKHGQKKPPRYSKGGCPLTSTGETQF